MIGTPSTARPPSSARPAVPPYESAAAVAMVKSAETVSAAVASDRSARDALDETKSPSPIAVASNTSAPPAGMLPLSSSAPSASQLFARVPVDASVVVDPRTVAASAVALVPLEEVPPPPSSGKDSCALAGPGTATDTLNPMASATMLNRRYRVLLITSLLPLIVTTATPVLSLARTDAD